MRLGLVHSKNLSQKTDPRVLPPTDYPTGSTHAAYLRLSANERHARGTIGAREGHLSGEWRLDGDGRAELADVCG